MASVQCSKCEFGIHYHGEPEGIEYSFIKDKDWEHVCSSRFDPENKQYRAGDSSPLLYRTDTIELDFEGLILKAWRCPNCGAIMFFDIHGNVIATYEESLDKKCLTEEPDYNYVVFDDYSWDVLTESMIPNWKICQKFTPSMKARITNSELIVADADGKVKEYKCLAKSM